ncbi:MAG TPA: carboxylating nicotinate-nucleotide diphosphorylase [Clostridiaceae bacterium]
MNWLIIDEQIRKALLEDMYIEDITTDSTIEEESNATVELLAREDGILSGLQVFARVFSTLGDVKVNFLKRDGDRIRKDELVANVIGNTRTILKGERVALNYLQRMCGVATLTNKFVQELEGTNTKLLDTRKTTPNMRLLEKYSVKVGGGENHRFSLSDGILLKDNHIAAAGGILKAVKLVRENASFVRKIEVEVENLQMVQEAIDAKVDIIMLDNMNLEEMKEAVTIINKRALTEASGDILLNNIRQVAMTGVDYISVGAITHSYKAFNLSLKNLVTI